MDLFSLKRPYGLIQSLSRNVRMMCVCVSACAIAETSIPVEWRLLVKDRIANYGIPLEFFSFLPFL